MRVITLRVLLATALTCSGCAHRGAAAHAVMAAGMLAIGAGLLMAGACDRNETRRGSGAICSGEPDAEDVAAGMAVVAAGGAMLLTGMEMEKREKPRKLRGPALTPYAAPSAAEPEPEPRMEPRAPE